MSYSTVNLSPPTLLKPQKTFARKKTYLWHKMRRLQNFKKILMSHIVETSWLSFETVLRIITWITWSEIAVQIKRFLELWEFFKNHGITWGTSDFDFCDLLDELFYMAEKHISKKKIELSNVIWSPIYRTSALCRFFDQL